MSRLEKKLHPIDGVAIAGVLLPSTEAFQEASDWPSKQKGRFREAALLQPLSAALMKALPGSRRRDSLPIALFARTLRIAL